MVGQSSLKPGGCFHGNHGDSIIGNFQKGEGLKETQASCRQSCNMMCSLHVFPCYTVTLREKKIPSSWSPKSSVAKKLPARALASTSSSSGHSHLPHLASGPAFPLCLFRHRVFLTSKPSPTVSPMLHPSHLTTSPQPAFYLDSLRAPVQAAALATAAVKGLGSF